MRPRAVVMLLCTVLPGGKTLSGRFLSQGVTGVQYEGGGRMFKLVEEFRASAQFGDCCQTPQGGKRYSWAAVQELAVSPACSHSALLFVPWGPCRRSRASRARTYGFRAFRSVSQDVEIHAAAAVDTTPQRYWFAAIVPLRGCRVVGNQQPATA